MPNINRRSKKSTSFGSPPDWAATAIPSPSPAASEPSIEDLVMGAFPGLPKVYLHNPVLAYEVGDEFMNYLYKAKEGRLDPFVLVVEGSIPNEKIKQEGYWAALGTDKQTGQPIPTTDWIDWLAPKAFAVVAIGTCATYGGIHAMEGNPTGCMGLADYLGWKWKSKAGLPIINVPGCPVQPDNFMETVLHLLYHAAGLAPPPPLGRSTAAQVALRGHRSRGLRSGRLLRAGPVRHRLRPERMPGQDRLLGTGRQLQRAQAGLDGRCGRLSQRGRHLHRLHHARLPGQVHALHGRTAGRAALVHRSGPLRRHHPHAPRFHATARPTRNPSGGIPAPN